MAVWYQAASASIPTESHGAYEERVRNLDSSRETIGCTGDEPGPHHLIDFTKSPAFVCRLRSVDTSAEARRRVCYGRTVGTERWRGPYLIKSRIPLDPWGRPFLYSRPGPKGKDFEIRSCGPDGRPDTADDISG